jgi:SAM-dependent methyltransferase
MKDKIVTSELENQFEANKTLLESAYIAAKEPWQQSGFGLRSKRTYQEWEALRRPVADSIPRSGTFLDIGCANGYLLECVMGWVGERGLKIVPYGLDFSEKLVALARQRLPRYADNIFAGNAWDWVSPRRFSFARTELVYVPDGLHRAYISRLMDLYLEPGGKLLVAEYWGRVEGKPGPNVGSYLSGMGFAPEIEVSGSWQGVEQTRIVVLTKNK